LRREIATRSDDAFSLEANGKFGGRATGQIPVDALVECGSVRKSEIDADELAIDRRWSNDIGGVGDGEPGVLAFNAG